MQQILHIVDELLAQVRAVQIKDDAQRNLDKKLRLEFSYNSNHIEGNTLTYGETELLLIFGKTQGQHELREYEEMEAHDVAFKTIKEWASDKEQPLTEMAIKNLNEIILVKPYWKEAITPDGQLTRREIKVGDYKKYANHVQLQNGEIFYYTSPADTPIQMGELIEWYRNEEEKKELHPVALAALLHYKFVRIHPFDDGNGRISRLLMNYVLIKNNLPPVIIKSSDKKSYLFALNRADTGNIEAFINYIAEQLVWSLQLYLKAAKGESLDEPGDLDKKLFLLKKKLGEDVDAKVEIKYVEEAIKQLIQHTLIPLAAAWKIQLEKFDPLFNSSIYTLTYGLHTQADINIVNLALTLLNNLNLLFSKVNVFEPIVFSAYFTGLRNSNNKNQLSAGQLICHFFENNYEITYNGNDEKINKLYHQPLTEEEITTITESFRQLVLRTSRTSSCRINYSSYETPFCFCRLSSLYQ